ncbi:MAG: type II toxin-antitoxin system Phd/YefM family antitoxin [Dehalococcoidia bacterium]
MKSVADAKKTLSELMSKVAYNNERFLIQRRGKPMAALVSIEDLARLEKEPVAPKGLVAALAEFEELESMVEEIYRQRERAQDRPVDLEQ